MGDGGAKERRMDPAELQRGEYNEEGFAFARRIVH